MKTFLINLLPSFFVKFFARAYVAGVGIESGIEKARKLWIQHQITSTIDVLGEEATNKEEVEDIVQIYINLLQKLAKEEFPKHISVKPTSLGIEISKDYCIENLRNILTKSKQGNIFVTLDMEDSHHTTTTLEIYKILRSEYQFGTVLQSRLFRTKEDIMGLKGLNARIRICIGVYNEEEKIALTRKEDMKNKLVEYVALLLDNDHQVDVATHDHKYIVKSLQEIEKRGISTSQVEFQFLLGVPRERIQRELIQRGYTVRVYVPFTIKWKSAIAYLRRRLIENPSIFYLGGRDFIGRIFQPITKKRRKPILPPHPER
ncbi:MAG: proline dehydrogenase family protein [Candidatus Hodarchaeales archaeon]